MGNNNKQQKRAELHKTIWGIVNDLRGEYRTKLDFELEKIN